MRKIGTYTKKHGNPYRGQPLYEEHLKATVSDARTYAMCQILIKSPPDRTDQDNNLLVEFLKKHRSMPYIEDCENYEFVRLVQ